MSLADGTQVKNVGTEKQQKRTSLQLSPGNSLEGKSADHTLEMRLDSPEGDWENLSESNDEFLPYDDIMTLKNLVQILLR